MILIVIAFLCLIPVVQGATPGAWCYVGDSCINQDLWGGSCNGTRQSPIDIVSAKATRDSSLKPFTFTNFDSRSALTSIKNTEKTVKVIVGGGVTVSGGGLPEKYNVLEFHLHWGDGVSTLGSEHALDGKRFPMELHIVSIKASTSNLTAALQDPKGLAVLGFFIEVDELTSDQPASWKTLTAHLKNISVNGQEAALTDTISLDDLLPGVDRTKFYRYLGSLTAPDCDESVVWTVFKNPVKVSRNLIASFTTVHDMSSAAIIDNYRKIQPAQPVTYSSSPKTCSSFGLLLFGLALWMS